MVILCVINFSRYRFLHRLDLHRELIFYGKISLFFFDLGNIWFLFALPFFFFFESIILEVMHMTKIENKTKRRKNLTK